MMSNPSKQRSIDPVLFDWPSTEPALLASCCHACEAMAFPAKTSCMACGSTSVFKRKLPVEGKLWTFTIQHFMPKSPYNSWETEETFQPFGVGYVELPGALRIETRIRLDAENPLTIGMAMALAFYPHRTDPDGTEIINYAFKPV